MHAALSAVQEATYKAAPCDDATYLVGLKKHFDAFYRLGGRRIVITGGEPTVVMPRVLDVLNLVGRYSDLEVLAMYTNGSRLMKPVSRGSPQTIAQALKARGLASVNLSVHDYRHAESIRIFSLNELPSTELTTQYLRECGLPFRLNMTLHRGGVATYEDFTKYVAWGFAMGANDIYVRDLFEYAFDQALCASDRGAVDFASRHRINVAHLVSRMHQDTDRFSYVGKHAETTRDKTEYTFEYGQGRQTKRVYLARLTVGTEEPDALPYLVYMPDGQLYRGWLGEPDRITGLEQMSPHSG